MTVLDSADGAPLASMLASIGVKVRQLRKERSLSVERLSEASGLSTGIISQIERGKGNPSFVTLVQLAHGLDIPVGRLLPTEHHKSPVVRRSERKSLDGHEFNMSSNGVFQLLTPDLDGALEATWVETPPGSESSATPFQHRGEEFGIILSGEKDVYLDGVKYHLETGDSIRYSSSIPHWYANNGTETCISVWVITPPSW